MRRQRSELTESRGQQLPQASGRREVSPPKALTRWPQLKGLLSKGLPGDGELPMLSLCASAHVSNVRGEHCTGSGIPGVCPLDQGGPRECRALIG